MSCVRSYSKALFTAKIAFLNANDLQTALKACLLVRDWEMLMDSVQIPEQWTVIANARLLELTVQELQVSL